MTWENFGFIISKYGSFFAKGMGITLGLAAFGVAIGVVVGTLIAMLRLSRFHLVRLIAVAYIEIVRGVPLLVQVFFAYYALPMFLNIDTSGFATGAIVLGLNSAAYVAEIVRAGIQSIDKGQSEAARSLGMSASLCMLRVVLPQAIRNILPALGNEFVVIIKESSLVSVIGVKDLMFQTQTVKNNSYVIFETLLICAGIYFVLTFTLSKLVGKAEANLRRTNKRRRLVPANRLEGSER